jgi:arylsulfatase A
MGIGHSGSDRRRFLKSAAGIAAATLSAQAQANTPPNIVLIVADDLGSGDLSCYGSRIQTPYIDQMAQEGVRFTQFATSSPVCTPSRAGWMTGRYSTRFGLPRVLDPSDTYGLPDSETTMAQMLKSAGYSTMCVGKWHLGSQAQYMPLNRGFDEYFGIPNSTDQGNRPLMQNLDVIEAPARLDVLAQRYTQQAVDFVNRSKDRPFFLYLPHAFPHLPLASSPAFTGRSARGPYGDAVQEFDWSVGQILQTLKSNSLDSNTLVMVSSDHGPWFQGSNGGLRGRKGETYEGGVRVPFVARFPNTIPGGQVCHGFATSLDILPTIAGLTGAPLPPNPLDGIDIRPLLSGQQTDLPREAFLYFNDVYLQCARVGPWKLHVTRYNSQNFAPVPAEGRVNLPLRYPELYDLTSDMDESYDRSSRNQPVVADIQARIQRLIQTFPFEIQNAWSTTMALQVEATPAGCSPILKRQ